MGRSPAQLGIRLAEHPVEGGRGLAVGRARERLGEDPVHAAGQGEVREGVRRRPVDAQDQPVAEGRPVGPLVEAPGHPAVQEDLGVLRHPDGRPEGQDALRGAIAGDVEADVGHRVRSRLDPELDDLLAGTARGALVERPVVEAEQAHRLGRLPAAVAGTEPDRQVVVLALGPEAERRPDGDPGGPRVGDDDPRIAADAGDRGVDDDVDAGTGAGRYGQRRPPERDARRRVAGAVLRRDRQGQGHRGGTDVRVGERGPGRWGRGRGARRSSRARARARRRPSRRPPGPRRSGRCPRRMPRPHRPRPPSRR